MDLTPLSKEAMLLLIMWSLAWKIPALWRAARRGDKLWYVSLLLFGTLGVVEAFYLFIVSKETKANSKQKKKTK